MPRKSVQREPSYSMRTDGRTDMTKLIVAFRDFANAANRKGNLIMPILRNDIISSFHISLIMRMLFMQLVYRLVCYAEYYSRCDLPLSRDNPL